MSKTCGIFAFSYRYHSMALFTCFQLAPTPGSASTHPLLFTAYYRTSFPFLSDISSALLLLLLPRLLLLLHRPSSSTSSASSSFNSFQSPTSPYIIYTSLC